MTFTDCNLITAVLDAAGGGELTLFQPLFGLIRDPGVRMLRLSGFGLMRRNNNCYQYNAG